MTRPRIRFGLKLLLILVLVACVGLAIYVRPSFYAVTTVDIRPHPTATPIKGEVRATISAMMRRSGNQLAKAIAASPKATELLKDELDPTQWIMERIDTIPVGEEGLIEIRLRGDPDEKETLEVALQAIVSYFSQWLSEATRVSSAPDIAAWSLDSNVEIKSGWGPARKTRK